MNKTDRTLQEALPMTSMEPGEDPDPNIIHVGYAHPPPTRRGQETRDRSSLY